MKYFIWKKIFNLNDKQLNGNLIVKILEINVNKHLTSLLFAFKIQSLAIPQSD